MPQRLKLDCGGELGARHDATAPRVYCKRAESERTKPQARGEGASAQPRTSSAQPRDRREPASICLPVRVVRGNWYRVLAYRPPKSRLSSDVTLRILDYGIPIVERSSISTHLGETSPIRIWPSVKTRFETRQSPRTSARHLQSIWPSVKTRVLVKI